MNKKPQAPRQPKKPYAVPKLVKYGDVRTLTQAGVTAPKENMGGMQANSSRAIKENIARIGTHPLGIGLYLFNYKPEFHDLYGPGRQLGVMADEVEQVMPAAVSLDPKGHAVVDYAMLGVRRSIR